MGSPQPPRSRQQADPPPSGAPGSASARGAREAAPDLHGISTVAAETGVSERTLRYYEELGLLQPSARRPGGGRLYSTEDARRVRHIRDLQDLMGFNLDEIRGLVEAEDHLDALRQEYRSTGDPSHQREVIKEAVRTLEDLREKIRGKQARLESFLADLDARITRHKDRLASRI